MSTRTFMYSGSVNLGELHSLKNMISNLGGKIVECKDEQFVNACSHIICFNFFASVKIMSGLVSGKWLVSKEYVISSNKAGHWLNEEPFEIKDHKEVAKFMRLKKRKIYSESVYFVKAFDRQITRKLTSVLVAGGAFVLNEDEIIKENIRVHAALSDKESLEAVKAVVGEYIPILHLDYIKKTIFFKLDKGNTTKFLLNPNIANVNCLTISEELNIQDAMLEKFGPLTGNIESPRQRIRRRKNVKEPQKKIFDFFFKKEHTSSSIQPGKADCSYADDDIEIVREVKKFKKDPIEILLNHSPTKGPDKLVSSTRSNTINTMKSEKINVTLNNETLPFCPEQSQIDISSDTIVQESEANKTLPARISVRETDNKLVNIKEIENNIPTIKESENKLEASKETEVKSSTIKDIEGIDDIKENENNFAEPERLSIFRENALKLGEFKKLKIKLEPARMKKILSNFLVDLNTSQFYLKAYHLQSYTYHTLKFKVQKLDIIDSNYLDCANYNDLRINTKRYGRSNVNSLEKVKRNEPRGPDDRIVEIDSLDWMMLRIQPDIIPNATALGTMLKNILMSPFRDVTNKAINIFGSILNIHPPHNKKMRDYYLKVFQEGIPDDKGYSNPKGWNFISVIVHDLLKDSPLDYDANMIFSYIIHLLQLDLMYYNECPVSVKSLVSYRLFWVGVNQNPAAVNYDIKELLQLWIKSVQIRSKARRKITQLVCIMLEILWKWSDINNPFLLTSWPFPSSFTSIADEIFSQFKGYYCLNLDYLKLKLKQNLNLQHIQIYVSSNNILTLLNFVVVPWQRMFLTFLGYRAKDFEKLPSNLTIFSLRDLLEKEVALCTKETLEENMFPHSIRVQFLIVLITSYSHMTGVKYCKMNLIQDLYHSLNRKRIINCPVECVQRTDGDDSSPASQEQRDETNLEGGQNLKPKMSIDGENESNPVVRKLVHEVINLFVHLPKIIHDFSILSEKCSHISDSSFTQAL